MNPHFSLTWNFDTHLQGTSMGMHLKVCLETVPLDSDLVENIYFAATTTAMKTVAEQMVQGLNLTSSGITHTISSDNSKFIPEIGEDPSDKVMVRTGSHDTAMPILLQSLELPEHLTVDGQGIPLVHAAEPDYTLVADILMRHIDKARVKKVASASTSGAITQLGNLINALEKGLQQQNEANKLILARASAADRLAQHRRIVKAVNVARELRNELADAANFEANGSEEQAAFLTGNQRKYASKALRRAAARRASNGSDVILDPVKEQDRVLNQLTKASFAGGLRKDLRQDIINHLSRLNSEQIQKIEDNIMACSETDLNRFKRLRHLLVSCSPVEKLGTAPAVAAASSDKVHTSALCWIPPVGQPYDAIQAIRRAYDKQANQWPPHINLLYPFVPVGEFEEAVKKLANALQDVSPFEVTMQDVKHFAHGRSCTDWMHPEETEEFVALQAACRAVFPHCDDLSTRSATGFTPHLTVGQCKTEAAVASLIQKAQWQPFGTKCGEICLISRDRSDAPFQICWRVKLGTGEYFQGPSDNDGNEAVSENDKQSSAKLGPLAGADQDLLEFIDSGTLSGYLNYVFFGGRLSYLSQMTAWEHTAEWSELSKAGGVGSMTFQSLWEALLSLGSTGYPLVLERSAATQMNPFQIVVKNVHTSLVDTASLCCANHSQIETYGPEGGEPIQDALVLVDPSLPTASAKIAKTALQGEIFTSVVLSRDLHMYTGSSMKVALLAHSLFSCLKLDSEIKSKSSIIAEIRREFRNCYQCASCGFGPVDHGGCSDLFSHHGEVDDEGGTASNACPSCGWFSKGLADWNEWDGKVPAALLSERVDKSSTAGTMKPLAAKMDLVLRILYSFRKTFSCPGNQTRAWYSDLARKLADWDNSFTTQDEVDHPVQVLLAIMSCDDDVVGDIQSVEAAFAPPCILAIVNEACARVARKKLSMASEGDDAKARNLAIQTVTKILGVTEETAPTTAESLLDPEPDRAVVMEGCSRNYQIDDESLSLAFDDETLFSKELTRKIASRWCRVLSLAKALRMSIIKRGGGWERLEQDMETSLDSYQDVVQDLQNASLGSFSEMCDVTEAEQDRTLTAMTAQVLLYNRGAQRQNLPDVRCSETLGDMARDMRMHVYQRRVGEKMTQWKSEGEMLVFMKARAADIGQYMEMLQVSTHVHGLNKETFWALWEAAVHDGCGGEKVKLFLETACDCFRDKYGPSSSAHGQARSRKKRKNGR